MPQICSVSIAHLGDAFEVSSKIQSMRLYEHRVYRHMTQSTDLPSGVVANSIPVLLGSILEVRLAEVDA